MQNRQALFPTYAPPPLRFVKGDGAWLTADTGIAYLDFISGISVNTLGHANGDLIDALTRQASSLWHLSNMFDVPGQAELAERYCGLTFADRVFFANSGAEAVECALKTARRFHYANGAPQKIDVISFSGAFHGRTYAAMNAAGNPNYLEGFGPSLPGYSQVPFGDHDALKSAISETTAAVIVEPVQGEGGVRALPTEHLAALRALCDAAGVLLIYDEVQCGAGRTGKLFAHQWAADAEPDLMAAAKGIGGGFPLGMCLATEAVATTMGIGAHGTTYGGNALAMAVGHAVLDHIERPDFLNGVVEQGAAFKIGLDALAANHSNLVSEIRGKGLLVGVKMKAHPKAVQKAAREEGLLIGIAGDNTIRMAPPLNVTSAEVDKALGMLDAIFASLADETKEVSHGSGR